VDISEEEKNLLLQNITAAKKAASAIDQVIEGWCTLSRFENRQYSTDELLLSSTKILLNIFGINC
jgi:hypothetical protein